MNEPLISIIVPVYKVEKLIDQCIDSIVRQSYKNLEIILVDDGSPDESPAKCDEWAQRDSRIRVIHQDNQGVSASRNNGVKEANGQYIGFIDSDDFIDEDMYQRLLAGFDTDSAIAITCCMVHHYANGQTYEFWDSWIRKQIHIVEGKDFGREMLLEHSSHSVWNKLYRADLVRRVPFREGRVNEDVLFMFDLSRIMKSENLKMVELPIYGYNYRLSSSGICQTQKRPFAIPCIENVDIMIQESTNDAEIKNILQIKQINQLEGFLKELLFRSDWKELYFKRYYQQYKETFSWSFVRNNYGMKRAILLLILRVSPQLRKRIILLAKTFK